MRLLIADDHRIVLEGIEALLRSAGHCVVARCTTGDEVLRRLATETPDILLLDVQMPGPTGIEILRRLRAERRPIRIVLLSSSINSAQALEALRLGADGLLLKEAASRDLLECLSTVAAGRQWIDPAAARLALDAAVGMAGSSPNAATLTPREAEIVRHIARGRRNKEVARALEISEGTVKMHLHRIYEKLGVKNRTELSAVARDRGLI